MAKTIVEFSGGLDSTYALYDILTNTSDEVVCIHFDHSYSTERIQNLVSPNLQIEMHQYQTAQCRKIIKWCSDNIRSVTMIIKSLAGMVEDETTLHFRARTCAKYANDNGFTKVVRNDTRRVDIPWRLPDLNDPKTSIWHSVNAAFAGQVDAGKTITYVNHCEENSINIAQRISNLPSGLYDLIAACSNPKQLANGEYEVCKDCQKEAWRAFVSDALSRSLTTAANFPTWFVSDLDSNPTVTFAFYEGGVSKNVSMKKFDLINNQVRREIDLSSSTFGVSANSAGYLANTTPTSNSRQRWSGTGVSLYQKSMEAYYA